MKRAFAIVFNTRTLVLLLTLGVAFALLLDQVPSRHFDVRSVSATEAGSLIDAGALIVDVRGQEGFDRGHIAGALLIPLAVLRAGIPESIANAKHRSVVVYCGNGESRGPEGTRLLSDAGFAQAVNVRGGIAAWAAAGLPVIN